MAGSSARSWCYFSTSGGEKVKIDKDDLPRVSQHNWRSIRKDTGRLKVVTDVKTEKGYRQLSLGKFLMKPPKGKMVYPRRFVEGFDYRKGNLIICTMQERQQILPKNRKGSSSKFKGVSFVTALRRWRASIKVNGKSISLGTYGDEEDAAYAYNSAARTHFGENAYQNVLTKKKKRAQDSND